MSVQKDARVICLPVADGGEGTIEVFEAIGTGRVIKKDVIGPIGRRVSAKYILTSNNEAIIEMAQASGLTLICDEERNPMKTTTYGTGELMADAVERGAKKILLFIGGSATNDGGLGMAQALGASYTDKQGNEINYNCEGLKELFHIDGERMRTLLAGIEIEIACDVQNTLCGDNGASMIYGPQKGADKEMVREMDQLLFKMAKLIGKNSGVEVLNIPGSGAAGGIAVPLIVFAGAKMVSGIETILRYIEYEKHLKGADYVFTGEGKIDSQTAFGKTITGILEVSKKEGVPVIAFGGILDEGYENMVETGMKSCFCILPGAMNLDDAMENGQKFLEDCVKRVVRLL